MLQDMLKEKRKAVFTWFSLIINILALFKTGKKNYSKRRNEVHYTQGADSVLLIIRRKELEQWPD